MLQGLPLEVLVEILRLVLVQDHPIDTHGPMGSLKEICQRYSRINSRGNHLKIMARSDLSLLAVSHAIRGVALPIFWGENTFRLYSRTTSGANISTEFLRLQQPATVNIVRKLEMELAFGQRRKISTLHEFLCNQFEALAGIEGLDNTGRLIIDAMVESEWGNPLAVICEAIVGRVLKAFEMRFASLFPNLDSKYVNLDLNMRQGWCVAHAPEKAVPQLFIGCLDNTFVMDLAC